MKSTKAFLATIENGLREMAFTDLQLAEALKKENKNIKDCCTYIINQVKKSGENGFTDDEVFSMAKHYFFEDDVKPGDSFRGNVVVNHKVKLTAEEIEAAKEKARKEIIAEEKTRMRKKASAPKKKSSTKDQPKLL